MALPGLQGRPMTLLATGIAEAVKSHLLYNLTFSPSLLEVDGMPMKL